MAPTAPGCLLRVSLPDSAEHVSCGCHAAGHRGAVGSSWRGPRLPSGPGRQGGSPGWGGQGYCLSSSSPPGCGLRVAQTSCQAARHLASEEQPRAPPGTRTSCSGCLSERCSRARAGLYPRAGRQQFLDERNSEESRSRPRPPCWLVAVPELEPGFALLSRGPGVLIPPPPNPCVMTCIKARAGWAVGSFGAHLLLSSHTAPGARDRSIKGHDPCCFRGCL